ncbi:MAG: leucyl aminopeptidase [Gammaproteobacteria bacterium]|jgi:leucyl aminopeptidase|nr:leucyl aminopeptidase [Gammaproteobacteria bacterium]
MKFTVKNEKPAAVKTGCVVLGVFERRRLSDAAQQFDKTTRGLLTGLMKDGEMDGKCGQTLLVHYPRGTRCERALLVGCGKQREFSDSQYRQATAAAANAVNTSGATDAVSYLADLDVPDRDTYWKVCNMVEITTGQLYQPDAMKSRKNKTSRPMRRLAINVGRSATDSAHQALVDGQAIAAGVELARVLGDLPGNVCTPAYLASQARDLGKQYKKLKVSVMEEATMKKLGMGALLSVSRGSEEPAKLISLEYSGGKPGDKPVVLVGKGVTFDSGGISIKPASAMDEMKFDMCGAASVLGTLKACAEMELRINVVGIIPATENLPGGTASKPGDIVTSLSGQTIEILNTDAEGRLILCDALSYCEKFNPDVVIDIATLTGACVIALGSHAAGLLSNDDELADDLLAAGVTAGDRAWHLPLWDEYQKQLDSNFADFANIGGREAGTITAACFLSRFTEDYRWAHIDIAGVAWKQGKEKGATGRPVSLLTRFLQDRCAANN